MVTELQETQLMARIEGGDLVALEAKYHLQSLTALRNCCRSLTRQHDKDSGGSSEEKKDKGKSTC